MSRSVPDEVLLPAIRRLKQLCAADASIAAMQKLLLGERNMTLSEWAAADPAAVLLFVEQAELMVEELPLMEPEHDHPADD